MKDDLEEITETTLATKMVPSKTWKTKADSCLQFI